MIATNIEQSKHLLELGIDPSSADMFWLVTNKARLHALTEPLSKYSNWENYPAWSLVALLNVISYPTLSQDYNGKWSCMEFPGDEEVEGCDNPIDACYEMILNLHEQKLL